MAQKTLGNFGKVFSWIIYLLLLYSLTAAYISASLPLFQNALSAMGIALPNFIIPFILPVLFGSFIYFGTSGVDIINRLLIAGLIMTYILLIATAPGQVKTEYFIHTDFSYGLLAIPVVITSFGYHIIIPSLSSYLHYNCRHLKRAILIGSAIPLAVYIIWQFLTLGTIPLTGEVSLANSYQAGQSATVPLVKLLKNPFLTLVAQFFSFFAIVTSFLGVTLSLSDFLLDGLKLKKHRLESRILAIILTFIPPLIFVYTYKRGFILALEYAGAFVALLLGFLPALMAWQVKKPRFYQTKSGKTLLIFIMIISWVIVFLDIMGQLGYFNFIYQKYLNK
jgi:tyrosine-specific transport protein